MEECTKIAYDLDESEYKNWKSCFLAKRVKIISANETKNASSKFLQIRTTPTK